MRRQTESSHLESLPLESSQLESSHSESSHLESLPVESSHLEFSPAAKPAADSIETLRSGSAKSRWFSAFRSLSRSESSVETDDSEMNPQQPLGYPRQRRSSAISIFKHSSIYSFHDFRESPSSSANCQACRREFRSQIGITGKILQISLF